MATKDDETALDPSYLRNLRGSLGITQVEMAAWMGMPARTYIDIEAGRSTLREIHMWAAQMAAMRLYAGSDSGTVTLPPELARLAEVVSSKARAGL